MTIAALAVGNFDKIKTWWSTDHQVNETVSDKFITLPNSEVNAKLIAVRNYCGDMKLAVLELESRIGDDDGEAAAISYSELVGDVVDALTYEGIIPTGCAVVSEEGWLVMFSTEGDMVVGLNGHSITTYSEVLRQSQQDEVTEWRSVWDRMRDFAKEKRG